MKIEIPFVNSKCKNVNAWHTGAQTLLLLLAVGICGTARPEQVRLEVGNTVYVLEGNSFRTGVSTDGVGYVVSKDDISVLRVEPEPATEKGHLIHGAQLNPQVGESQGYDQRTDAVGVKAYDAAKTAKFPLRMSPGDILVKAVSSVDIPYGKGEFRSGIFDEFSALIVVSETPDMKGSLFAPAVIGWSDREQPKFHGVDLDQLVASLPAYDTSMIPAGERPDVEDIIKRINQFNPLYMQNSGTSPGAGYQTFCIRNWPEADTGNYGLKLVDLTDAAGLLLISDLATPEQKRRLAIGFISCGIQWLDPAKGLGTQRGANGGHLQWFQSAALFAQYARGLPVADVWNHLPGNWAQAFEITDEAMETYFTPHRDFKKPFAWYVREITEVKGNKITFQTQRLPGKADLTGQPMIRLRDGAQAQVTGPKRRKGAGKTTSVEIAGQPQDPFAPGDEIYFGPQYPMVAGNVDWAVLRAGKVYPDAVESFAARKNTPYRGLNKWSGGILTSAALGILPEEFSATRKYVAACNTGEAPEGSTEKFETHHAGAFVKSFWDAHWSRIRSIPARPETP